MTESLFNSIETAIHEVYWPHTRGHDLSKEAALKVKELVSGELMIKFAEDIVEKLEEAEELLSQAKKTIRLVLENGVEEEVYCLSEVLYDIEEWEKKQ